MTTVIMEEKEWFWDMDKCFFRSQDGARSRTWEDIARIYADRDMIEVWL